MKTSDTISELAAALALAQANYPAIGKENEGLVQGISKAGKSYEYKYKYADLASIFHDILPILGKHGLSVAQPTSFDRDGLFITTRLMHKSGEWIESEYPVCSLGGDHQKMGSAVTYAKRYAFCSLVGVAAGADDDDAKTAEKPRKDKWEVTYDSKGFAHSEMTDAAEGGVDALRVYWTSLSPQERLLIDWKTLQDIAIKADAARLKREANGEEQDKN